MFMYPASAWLVANLVAYSFLSSATLFAAAAPDVIAILPDRSTGYPNGLHNGLWLSSTVFNLTLEIRDVGNFNADISHRVLQEAIDAPAEEQPKVYCVWPVSLESRDLLQVLHRKHGIPIVQMNQLPSEDRQYEWDHLLGYAGPDDALRARNAGLMLIEALTGVPAASYNATEAQMRGQVEKTHQVAVLGYPIRYGGYKLSIDAFLAGLVGSAVEIIEDPIHVEWGSQDAYDQTLALLNRYSTVSGKFHDPTGRKPIVYGIYAMDDIIVQGAYQALKDAGVEPGVDIILVGTVANGARELIESGEQYGTTVQGPLLEGRFAIGMAHAYLTGGEEAITEKIRFTPHPIVTKDTWETTLISFLGEVATADSLNTWEIFYDRVAGPVSVEQTPVDICDVVTCEYIPRALFIVGYVLVATNYGLAVLAGILLYKYRNSKVIGIAQPFFLALVIVGSMIDTTSILFMSRDNRDYSDQELDRACVAWPVLLSLGHMVTSGTLAAKIYRVKVLVDAGLETRRVQLTVAQVSLFILMFVGMDAIVLVVWYVTDPFHWEVDSSLTDSNGYITEALGQCTSDGDNYFVYPIIIAILHLGVLIYANFLAYKTSLYHSISDSKSVAICLFNSIQLLLIGAPILALVGDNVATSYLIRICFVFLNNFGVLVVILMPKLYQCVIGNGDKLPDFDLFKISKDSRHARTGSKTSGSNEQREPKAAPEDNSSRGRNAVGAVEPESIPSADLHKEKQSPTSAVSHQTRDVLGKTGWTLHESAQERRVAEGEEDQDPELLDWTSSSRSDATTTPQETLDIMWKRRGYSRQLYRTLETAYYNLPTELQMSSFQEEVFQLVQRNDWNTIQARLRTPSTSPNPCNPEGFSLVHEISRCGRFDMLNAMLNEFGAGSEETRRNLVQVSDAKGRTPMHYACMGMSLEGSLSTERLEVVKLLTSIDRRMFCLLDMDGKTPLDCCPKGQTTAWQDFLYVVRDDYWERRVLHADQEEEAAPPLALQQPNSHPFPDRLL